MKLSKTRVIDWINPLKWWSFVVSKVVMLFVKQHMVEQWMYRFLECNRCLKQGSCEHCGCSLPDKMMNPNETDSVGRWGAFKNENDWNTYKAKHGIKFILEDNLDAIPIEGFDDNTVKEL